MKTKICPCCGFDKPSECFNVDRCQLSGLSSWCKGCKSVGRKKRIRTPEERRRQNLWTNYRITPEQYDILLQSQNGCCAICRKVRPLVVDHCHRTCRVRGLLCHKCNAAIGMLEEEKANFENAVRYLS